MMTSVNICGHQAKGHQMHIVATLSVGLTTKEVQKGLIKNPDVMKHMHYLRIGEKGDQWVAMQMSFYTKI